MKITKLHLLLILIAGVVAGVYLSQLQQERRRREEFAAQERARAEEMRRAEEARRLEERQKEVAVQAVAVAGEYWRIARREGRDIDRGQATLREAKETLAREEYGRAVELARRSIAEFKEAPRKDVHYTVQKRDNLWKIAAMPRHYGRGSKWVKIWRANQKKVPDFDLIYPRQVLLIPRDVNNN